MKRSLHSGVGAPFQDFDDAASTAPRSPRVAASTSVAEAAFRDGSACTAQQLGSEDPRIRL
eukprot:1346000-Prymnesium_polylepis.1